MHSMRAVGAFDDNAMTIDLGLRYRCKHLHQVFEKKGKCFAGLAKPATGFSPTAAMA
jgi:hypothetical protein